MTTNELIKRGIGHNCLSDAYDLGYHDAMQDDGVPKQLIEMGYKKGRADAIEEFRGYLKTVIPCEMPQDIWNMGVDNTCDRILKEQTE